MAAPQSARFTWNPDTRAVHPARPKFVRRSAWLTGGRPYRMRPCRADGGQDVFITAPVRPGDTPPLTGVLVPHKTGARQRGRWFWCDDLYARRCAGGRCYCVDSRGRRGTMYGTPTGHLPHTVCRMSDPRWCNINHGVFAPVSPPEAP